MHLEPASQLPHRPRYVGPEPTCELQALDLREPNEFDAKLLHQEGARFGHTTMRGAWLLAMRSEGPTPTPPPVPLAARRSLLQRFFDALRDTLS